MERVLIFLLLCCICIIAGGASLAGVAHVGSLVCTDCHVMHFSMSHNYRGQPSTFAPPPGGPFGALLKESPNDMCLACHDGTGFAPDVLGASPGDYVRQAGGLNMDGLVEPGYPSWSGHTLGSTSVAPGGTWSNPTQGLLCVDCHDPHGILTQFRNLRTSSEAGDTFEDKSLTFAYGSSNDLTKDVFLHDGFDVSFRYGVKGTDFNEPDPTKSAYGNWCGSCHGNFHGSGGSFGVGGASGGNSGSTPWVRHPAADVNIGQNPGVSSLAQYQSHVNGVKTMSSSGTWLTGTDVTPSCFSCHKAHGNKNAFGLIYMSGNGTVTEEGDSGGTKLNDLCNQCHTP